LQQNELELRNFLITKLHENGYATEQDAEVYDQTRVDVLAEKSDERLAIEVAFSDSDLLNAVAHVSQMRRFPKVDTAYVAMPKEHLTDDVRFLAQQTGVGIIGVSKSGIEFITKSTRFGANLGINASLPQVVMRGSQFDLSLVLTNHGAKILTDVEAEYLPAYPFERPKEAKDSIKISDLRLGESKTILFKPLTVSDALEGTYPLVVKVSSYRLAPLRQVWFLRVQ
jgi:hypothetical protein